MTKMDEGYQIVDIGIDPSRVERSPIFNTEQEILKQASDYPVIKVGE